MNAYEAIKVQDALQERVDALKRILDHIAQDKDHRQDYRVLTYMKDEMVGDLKKLQQKLEKVEI